MRHPTAGELLELHFGEMDGARRDSLAAHARGCAACRALLADLSWAERALEEAGEPSPPADGLERVLARIAAMRPVRRRRTEGLRAAVPSAAGLLAGALVLQHGGIGAALAFFAVGSLVTLALAPMLILELQGRPSWGPRRS
jgi:hypothetical protein